MSIRVTCNYKTIQMMAKPTTYQKHVAGSLQNIIVRKGGMCNDVAYLLSRYFLSSAKHRNFTRIPPENRRFPTHYGESETHACGGRARLQIKMQKRKEIESRLRQCSAKTNENLQSESTNVFARIFFSISRLHFYFHLSGYCY